MTTDPTILLLTPEQAATALGIGRTTVFGLLRSGQLPSVQIGRSRRVPVGTLKRYVELLQEIDREVAPAPPAQDATSPPRPPGHRRLSSTVPESDPRQLSLLAPQSRRHRTDRNS